MKIIVQIIGDINRSNMGVLRFEKYTVKKLLEIWQLTVKLANTSNLNAVGKLLDCLSQHRVSKIMQSVEISSIYTQMVWIPLLAYSHYFVSYDTSLLLP